MVVLIVGYRGELQVTKCLLPYRKHILVNKKVEAKTFPIGALAPVPYLLINHNGITYVRIPFSRDYNHITSW